MRSHVHRIAHKNVCQGQITYNPVVSPAVAADAVLGRVQGLPAEQVHGQGAPQAGDSLPRLPHPCC